MSFLITILVGSFLLWLPISSATGQAVNFVDALFTATTATCVTGLVTLPTVTAWSSFGQAVILLLIQIGGLGIITIMSFVMISLHKKLGIGDRLLIQDAFNLDTLSGLASFVKKVFLGTLLVEGVGALLYMTVFVPQMGIKGIWVSVFNSVSAFCNAGLDIISENSLADYKTNPAVNAITGLLIIIGGIGYIVWWDLLRIVKEKKSPKHLTLHSKIVIFTTLFLIFSGALAYFIFEYNNPLTIKNLSLGDKITVCLFQSVTTRTAGFFTIPQQNLTNPSCIITLLLMFIGGSPVGTAGGIKTITFAVLLLSAWSTLKNRNSVSVFSRTLPSGATGKALAVTATCLATVFVSTLALSAVTSASFTDVIFETVSAAATVGLSRNLTSSLNLWGKLIIVLTMYLGRVGPISLAVAFNLRKENKNLIKNPYENISIG
ncbi:MAG: potassium transporter KtrB [Ruminococcaceae bacterium]|nr:potassium transporter KtrB [Oscillospiraceae bacterium]